MKNNVIILMVTCCVLNFGNCYAFDNSLYPYLGLTAGAPLTSVSSISSKSSESQRAGFSPGFLAGGSAGIVIDEKMPLEIDKARVELEVAYRETDVTTSSNNVAFAASLTSYLVNGYLDHNIMLPDNAKMDLFLVAGAGMANVSIDSVKFPGGEVTGAAKNTVFAYQVGVGAGFEVTKKIMIDAAYKYLATSSLDLGTVKAEYGSHSIVFGVRHAFK